MEDLIGVLRTPPLSAGRLPRRITPIPLPTPGINHRFPRLVYLSPQAAIPLSLPNRPVRPPVPDLISPTSTSLPPVPPAAPPYEFEGPAAQPGGNPEEDPTLAVSQLQEKLLFLDSIGIDLFSTVASADSAPPHPALISSSLPAIRSTLDFLLSAGFTAPDLRHIFRVCPEVIGSPPSSICPVLTFLYREAGVQGIPGLRRAVRARPRLLVCDVASRLRPTLYFLQMLGIADVSRHAHILSSSVESRLLPRVLYLESAGLGPGGARAAARRFPQVMCYSIEDNLAPKLEYLVGEMGRDVGEVRRFPQYFSFSMDRRIRPRHAACADKGVRMELPALLKPSDAEFTARLEVCVGSTPPLKRSPLLCVA